MEDRFVDFVNQETWLYNEINDVLNRAIDESKMTRCQVAGVLMDMALEKLGRPHLDEELNRTRKFEDDGESWRP